MKNDRTHFALIAPIACAAILGLLAACSTGSGSETPIASETPATQESPAAPKNYKVYVSGYNVVGSGEGDTSNYPFYWDGGSRIALPGDTDDTGRALAIAVSGGSVYIAGNIGIDEGDPDDGIACYWKDGVRTEIPGNEAVAILVEGETVYAAVNGSWENVLINGVLSSAGGAAYVAGGSVAPLPGAAETGATNPLRYVWTEACGIAVSGGIVSTIGYGGSNIGTVPCRWDGTTLNQDLAAENGMAFGICASGGFIYAAGWHFDEDDKRVPCFWKGGDRTDLPTEAGDDGACVRGIKVIDGVVYTAGYRFIGDPYDGTMIPCYWIGTARTDLPVDGSDYGMVEGLDVGDGVVYAVGYYDDGSACVPCYWKGEARVDLPVDGGNGAFATGIALIEE